MRESERGGGPAICRIGASCKRAGACNTAGQQARSGVRVRLFSSDLRVGGHVAVRDDVVVVAGLVDVVSFLAEVVVPVVLEVTVGFQCA